MLGEGFDLPSLKIAAIHDAHKSIAVTLQFVGRFTRTGGDLTGDATAIVAQPDLDYDHALARLYAEDADWNELISQIAENAVGGEQRNEAFESGFIHSPELVTLKSLMPKMSTVVYTTDEEQWNPDAITQVFDRDNLLTWPIPHNIQDGVAWFVTQEIDPVQWGDVKTVSDVTHHLYVLFWDRAKKLLYINSSNNSTVHSDLANAVCGRQAEIIKGETVFRAMHGIMRLTPTNLGVLDVRNSARRFSMHVGTDVSEGFTQATAKTKSSTNVFAFGYENGARVSIGASAKGRIWSRRASTSLRQWVDWCQAVGAKLTDDSLGYADLLKNFIRPQAVTKRPKIVPLAVEWPFDLLQTLSEDTKIQTAGQSVALLNSDLVLSSHEPTGDIRFRVEVDHGSSDEYALKFTTTGMTFRALGDEANVVTRQHTMLLSEFLNKHGVLIQFEKDTVVEPPGILLKPDRNLPVFDPENLCVLDWIGTKLKKEVPIQAPDSVQARMLRQLQGERNWDILIHDDSAGEIADLVGITVREDGSLLVKPAFRR